MEKPTIRLIHHMARCGGTVICKCLACMQDVVLLSEIHPLGTRQFNPIHQAQQWFQLFNQAELQQHFSKPLPFATVIRIINEKVEQLNKKLILRDWTHLDYTAVPFVEKPSYRLLLSESLTHDFEVLRIATTRHPITQWLSLNRLAIIHGKLTLAQYLKGYLHFAEAAREIGFIRYEDFTEQPDAVLAQITATLHLQYDPDYTNKWMHYHKMTGDMGNKWQEIKPRKKPVLDAGFVARFAANKDYWAALEILGYEHFDG